MFSPAVYHLEKDEEKGLDEAEHAAAHEHHDEEGDAGHVPEDLLQALQCIRVLRQSNVLVRK